MVVIVGKVDTEADEVFTLADGREVTFHTAFRDKIRQDSVTFCTELNVWPTVTAQNLGIVYTFMRNATHSEAMHEIGVLGLEVTKVRLL